jgi:hypothetical protein
MHARATHSSSASLEAEEGNPTSDSSRKSKDRTSEEKRKRKNPSGVNTHEDTDANGELEVQATEGLICRCPTRSVDGLKQAVLL